jgi:hypothetical protein
MIHRMSTVQRNLIWLFLFAVAMAQVEAALVIHLRSLYYPDDPLSIFPIALMSHRDLAIELIRELATVLMIIAVAVLAERNLMRIFAAFVFVFGLWDIFYYVWLKLMIGWPTSWLEWDVLFLIPWPWFGPWICPVMIALLFTLWGGWILLSTSVLYFSRASLTLFLLGTLLALASFLLPAATLLPGGEEAFRGYEPGNFLWGLFLAGYLFMFIGLFNVATRNRISTNEQS